MPDRFATAMPKRQQGQRWGASTGEGEPLGNEAGLGMRPLWGRMHPAGFLKNAGRILWETHFYVKNIALKVLI